MNLKPGRAQEKEQARNLDLRKWAGAEGLGEAGLGGLGEAFATRTDSELAPEKLNRTVPRLRVAHSRPVTVADGSSPTVTAFDHLESVRRDQDLTVGSCLTVKIKRSENFKIRGYVE